MQIDSIIGVGVFLIFVAWSFNFYTGNFQEQAEPLKELTNTIQEKIIDYLEIDIYTIPVRFNSPASAPDTVLYLPFVWPEGTRNSTSIKEAGQSLGCEIQGDYVYWQSNLEQGNNYFTLEIANTSIAMGCQASINKSVTNHTYVFSEEKVRLISQSMIESMAAMAYSAFKDAIEVSGADFRVEIVNSTGTISYGPAIPKNRNVYVPESSNMIWESEEAINITIAVW